MRITFISDTHNRHKQITPTYFSGGDLLIHAGDHSSVGYEHEIRSFCGWFKKIPNYTDKIFVAGNHDRGFENNTKVTEEILDFYDTLTYLEDDTAYTTLTPNTPVVKVYGSPWQPEFYNWAFNLPKNGSELKEIWDLIPDDVEILVTHCPPYGILDRVEGEVEHLGCELLAERVKVIKPKIHVFGHIHTGYGYYFDGETHFINASILNEQYYVTHKPLTIEWDPETNELEFID